MASDLVFRTGYDFAFGERNDIDFGDEPSLTIQSAKDECDINLIVDRAKRGISPVAYDGVPQFGDFSEVGTYQEALDQVIRAQEAFGELPSRVRERFDNEPAKLLAFLANPANREEAISLGLVEAPQVPQESPKDGSLPQAGGNAVPASGVAPETPSA